MKRLSVIVPGYNTRKEWWVRCVASVRKALSAEDEIIVVDDGSREKVIADWWTADNGGMIQRRALAEKKVELWLRGVTRESFGVALEKLVAEKTLAGDYRFRRSEEKELALSGARRFFNEFAKKIVELSDGRCVYFAPDARSKTRNGNDLSRCWAEYAFHAVSSSGRMIPGKDYPERWFSKDKMASMDHIVPILQSEVCGAILIDKQRSKDAVAFLGESADARKRIQIITRVDYDGPGMHNLAEVTVLLMNARKNAPPIKLLSEVVESVERHQGAGYLPSTTTGNIPNSVASDNPRGRSEGCEVHVVRLERNSGLPTARNRGLEVAQGKYVTFVDSDDEVLPGAFDKCIAKLEEHGADVAVYGIRSVYLADGFQALDLPEDRYYGALTPYDVATLVRKRLFYYSCNKVFRRGFIDEHRMRFNPEGVPQEDAIFNVGLVVNKAKWVTLAVEGYRYYRYDGSIVSRYQPTLVAGTRACTKAWRDYKAATPGAVEEMDRLGLGWYDETSEAELERREWMNIWRRNTPYGLLARWRWIRARHGLSKGLLMFAKQAVLMTVRCHFYVGPLRRYHQKRFLTRIGAKIEPL